jgi:hypothetical protein
VGQRIGSNRIANTSVTGLKVADNAIRGNNIVAGQITGNLLGIGVIKILSSFLYKCITESRYISLQETYTSSNTFSAKCLTIP